MITEPPATDPATMSSPNLRRRYLLLFVLAGIIALVLIWHGVAAFRYAHIPFRSVLVPRPNPRAGQRVSGLAFSPTGRSLAVADGYSALNFWTIPQLLCVKQIAASVGRTVTASRWTPDSQRLLIGDYGSVMQWDVSGGKFLALPVKSPANYPNAAIRGYNDGYFYHVVSISGMLMAVAAPPGGFTVWNTITGKTLFAVPNSLPGKPDTEYPTDLCDVAISADDRLVATASMQGDGATAPFDIMIRAAKTGHVVRKWQWKQAILRENMVYNNSGGNLGETGLTFSPDGTLLAMADEYKVTVWDVNTGNLRRTLSEVGRSCGCPKKLVFFDKGRLLVSIGWDTAIPVWDVRTGALLQTFYGESMSEAVAVSPDGKLLASGGQGGKSGGRVDLWDVSRLLR